MQLATIRATELSSPPSEQQLLLADPSGRFKILALHISDRNSAPVNKAIETAKIVANLSVIGISAIGFPFGDLSDLSIRCFVLGDTAFKVWSGLGYVNSTLDFFMRDPLFDSGRNWPKLRQLVQVSLEIVIAVSSHLPGFLNTAGAKGADGILIQQFEYLGDVFFRLYSMRLSFQFAATIPYYFRNTTESKVFFLQLELVEAIKNGMESFAELSFEERKQFALELEEIRSDQSEQRVGDYLSKLMSNFRKNEAKPTASVKSTNIRNICLFVALAALPVAAFIVDNWQESTIEEKNRGKFGAVILSALPLSALHLTARCIRDTARHFFSLRCNLTTRLSPIKSLCYKALGTAISTLGVYGFFKTSECSAPPELPPLFCASAGVFFFVVFHVSIRTFIETSLQSSIRSQERDVERNQILVSHEYEKLSKLIRNIPPQKFAAIFQQFPAEIRSYCLNRAGLAESDVN